MSEDRQNGARVQSAEDVLAYEFSRQVRKGRELQAENNLFESRGMK